MSEAAVPARRPRRWPLYASLFLNVVLVTVVAIGAWNVKQFRDRMELGIGPWMPRQVERVLNDDEEAKAKVRAIREANREAFRGLFQASREAHDAVRVAIDADPFNPDALRSALRAKAGADQAIAEKSGDLMVEIASALTAEQRKLVRDRIRKRADKNDHRGPREERRGPPGEEDGPPPPSPGEGPPPPAGGPVPPPGDDL